MKRRFQSAAPVPFLALLFLLLHAGRGASGRQQISPLHGGKLLVTWVFTTGPLVGYHLRGEEDNPQTIDPGFNPETLANGFVVGPGPFADCDCVWHFHGSIDGVEDDGLGCGWGCMVKFSDPSTGLAITVAGPALVGWPREAAAQPSPASDDSNGGQRMN